MAEPDAEVQRATPAERRHSQRVAAVQRLARNPREEMSSLRLPAKEAVQAMQRVRVCAAPPQMLPYKR